MITTTRVVTSTTTDLTPDLITSTSDARNSGTTCTTTDSSLTSTPDPCRPETTYTTHSTFTSTNTFDTSHGSGSGATDELSPHDLSFTSREYRLETTITDSIHDQSLITATPTSDYRSEVTKSPSQSSPTSKVNILESGNSAIWISTTAVIITSVVLLEIAMLLIIVVCRKYEIRRNGLKVHVAEEELQGVYYKLEKLEQQSAQPVDNDLPNATSFQNDNVPEDEPQVRAVDIQTPKPTTTTVTVADVHHNYIPMVEHGVGAKSNPSSAIERVDYEVKPQVKVPSKKQTETQPERQQQQGHYQADPTRSKTEDNSTTTTTAAVHCDSILGEKPADVGQKPLSVTGYIFSEAELESWFKKQTETQPRKQQQKQEEGHYQADPTRNRTEVNTTTTTSAAVHNNNMPGGEPQLQPIDIQPTKPTITTAVVHIPIMVEHGVGVKSKPSTSATEHILKPKRDKVPSKKQAETQPGQQQQQGHYQADPTRSRTGVNATTIATTTATVHHDNIPGEKPAGVGQKPLSVTGYIFSEAELKSWFKKQTETQPRQQQQQQEEDHYQADPTRDRTEVNTTTTTSAAVHNDSIPGEKPAGMGHKPLSASGNVCSVKKDGVPRPAKKKPVRMRPEEKQNQYDQADSTRSRAGANTTTTTREAVHHDNIPGEKMASAQGKLSSTSGQHVYSVTKDEVPQSAKKMPVGTPPEKLQNQHDKRDSTSNRTGTVTVKNQPLDVKIKVCTTGSDHTNSDSYHPKMDLEMDHTYDTLDKIQKQIRTLSQSIPTLDSYGYVDLEKTKPVPKASSSIPALDVVDYAEDLRTLKPNWSQTFQKGPFTTAQNVDGTGFHANKVAVKKVAAEEHVYHMLEQQPTQNVDGTNFNAASKVAAKKKVKEHIYDTLEQQPVRNVDGTNFNPANKVAVKKEAEEEHVYHILEQQPARMQSVDNDPSGAANTTPGDELQLQPLDTQTTKPTTVVRYVPVVRQDGGAKSKLSSSTENVYSELTPRPSKKQAKPQPHQQQQQQRKQQPSHYQPDPIRSRKGANITTTTKPAVHHDYIPGEKPAESCPSSKDPDSSEIEHTYEALDKIQKQIHLLSQSIPTVDSYGYIDLDTVKPTPKASGSISALDVVGYAEDFSEVKPKWSQTQPKRTLTRAQNVNGTDFHAANKVASKKVAAEEHIYHILEQQPTQNVDGTNLIHAANKSKQEVEEEHVYHVLEQQPAKNAGTDYHTNRTVAVEEHVYHVLEQQPAQNVSGTDFHATNVATNKVAAEEHVYHILEPPADLQPVDKDLSDAAKSTLV